MSHGDTAETETALKVSSPPEAHTNEYSLRFQNDLERTDRLLLMAKINMSLFSNDPVNHHVYERQFQRLSETRSYLRAPYETDVSYRKSLQRDYGDKLRNACPKNVSLRFHGTSIMATQHIIENGVISSAEDHENIRKSHDVAGQISVTTTRSCDVSIRDYLDINKVSLPMGCLFVLLADANVDETDNMTMPNASLITPDGNQSRQFYRVLASPETLPIVKEWLKGKKLSPDLATEYEAFIQELEVKKSMMELPQEKEDEKP